MEEGHTGDPHEFIAENERQMILAKHTLRYQWAFPVHFGNPLTSAFILGRVDTYFNSPQFLLPKVSFQEIFIGGPLKFKKKYLEGAKCKLYMKF